MKYRKKPVVVEAVQWNGTNLSEIEMFCPIAQIEILDTAWEVGKGIPVAIITIPTLEGEHIASKGDYIIKGVKGEYYPCKPDIFEATYEAVDECVGREKYDPDAEYYGHC